MTEKSWVLGLCYCIDLSSSFAFTAHFNVITCTSLCSQQTKQNCVSLYSRNDP